MAFLCRKRLVILFSTLLISFLLLIIHLGIIQLARGDYYAFLALERETQSVTLEDYPRGEILDRRLQSLTGSVDANRVVVFPRLVADKQAVTVALADILGLPATEVAPYLTGKPCYLPYPLTPAQAKTIREHQWSGILVLPVHLRYGTQPLAAQVIGYLGRVQSLQDLATLNANRKKTYSLSDWVGQTGLEKYYEEELNATRPKSSARLFIDAAGRPLPGLCIQAGSRTIDPGRQHLVTTIDARVKKGAVVVMDTHTGDILALASRPFYDPRPESLAHYLATGENGTFTDQGTALFQPGSVFKVVVAAAALTEGIV